MKIGIFTYDFEHKKTQEGLMNLFLNDYKIECMFAAPWIKLDFYKSKRRISTKDLFCMHPEKIAQKLQIPYHVIPHNSDECFQLIKQYKLDLGIILGARIISTKIITAFKIGILNLHPGLLPQNRGLDNIKWAIINNMKQGATVHLIEKEIDRGCIILQREIKIYSDDTILDLLIRVQSMEQTLMLESLKILKHKRDFERCPEGHYFKSVPPLLDECLPELFKKYIEKRRE